MLFFRLSALHSAKVALHRNSVTFNADLSKGHHSLFVPSGFFVTLRLTFLLAACAASAGCTTSNADTGDVVAIHGTNKPYLSRLVPDGAGGQTAMYAQAFEGWRFIENRDGTCALELSRITDMLTLETPLWPVQKPVTKVLRFKVDCSALTQDALPTLPSLQPAPSTTDKMI